MKTTIAQRASRRDRRGTALLTSVVLLAIAGVTLGSIMTATLNYSRHCEQVHDRDRAAFLADAGLQTALVKLNESSEANISFIQSRTYFGQTNTFRAPDWGFNTYITLTNGQYVVNAIGRYRTQRVTVRGQVSLGAGSRSIHALYAHALFAGNASLATNYVLQVGGTGTGADYVRGDTYSGKHIQLSGTSRLRLPEILNDRDGDNICGPTDTWVNAYAVQTFTNPLTAAQFNAYKTTVSAYTNLFYNNGKYDLGEPFVDTVGNGVYDAGEAYTDANGNGRYDFGDTFIDRNGNGVYNSGVDTVVDNGNGKWDSGEEWTEDSSHSQRLNGKYDKAGGYYSGTTWKTSYKVGSKTYYCTTWAAEAFEDAGDGVYNPVGETYSDRNGVYDEGETYLDDRNTIYDYGTQAVGDITGMPTAGPGQQAADGHDQRIDPPDLTHMYYNLDRNGSQPTDALLRWGNDVAVVASDYGTAKAITDSTRPEHIFVRNPPTSGSTSSGGKTIYGRSYTALYNTSGVRVDDYFLEDPTDSTYNSYVTADEIDGTVYTAPMYVNVKAEHNIKLYYVDGNVYLHHPQVYSMRFRQPGTRITIVAKGNITISDEFYYNADYADGLERSDMSSRIVKSPSDALCLIALKNPACTDSGNIYIGDRQFGTGGSIHAMLYAENNFVDNNINSVDQQFISVFGNMTAGNQVKLNRTVAAGQYRTRLDVTLDERIRNGEIIVPGLPHPVGSQRSIWVDTAWHSVPGTWSSVAGLQ